jgi:hypothetical protein
MSDDAQKSTTACQVKIEIGSRRGGLGSEQERTEVSVTISCPGPAIQMVAEGTRVCIQLQADHSGLQRSNSMMPPATDSAAEGALPIEPEQLPKFGTPEYQVAYRQQWAEAGRKTWPNLQDWGSDETA